MNRSHSHNGRTAEPAPIEVLRDVTDQVTDLASRLGRGAFGAIDDFKEQLSEVIQALGETVHEEAEQLFQKQRGNAARKFAKAGRVVHQVAHALHAVRLSDFADMIDHTADNVESISEYVAERNLDAILQDAGDFINRNRGLAIGALFVAGLAAARVLKSSAPAAHDEDDRQGEEDGGQHHRGSRSRNGAARNRGRDR